MKLSLALVVLFAWRIAAADEASLLAGLETEDRTALSEAITAIEHAPTTPALADVLFAAGRACEDRLHDPARALTLYERIVREVPDAGISIAAGRRITQLQGVRDHGPEAADLADLVANADRLPRDDVERRAAALIAANWPGAADAALWLADWQCRTTRFAAAQTHYAEVLARWPYTEQSRLALRNAAGCAIDARDWALAEQLARRLPALDPIEAAVKDDLLDAAARGRRRDHLYTASWLGLAVAIVVLLASFVEAALRGGRRRPALRPPVEVMFLAPVAAVIVAASFTAHRAIAPAVLRISLVGLALAWLSGATLDLLRSRNRAVRMRALVHVAACAIGVLAIGYIAMTHDGLLDMLAETVRFGPGA
jgi:tetratricopeptide (TPR) repeat protein